MRRMETSAIPLPNYRIKGSCSIKSYTMKADMLNQEKGLGSQTPVQYMIKHNKICHMGWTHTDARVFRIS